MTGRLQGDLGVEEAVRRDRWAKGEMGRRDR